MAKKINCLSKYIINQKILAIVMANISYAVLCLNGSLRTYDLSSWLIFMMMIILFIKTDITKDKMRKETIIFSILFAFLTVYGSLAYILQENKELSIFTELLTIKNLASILAYFNIYYIILKNIFSKLDDFALNKKTSKIKKTHLIFIISFIIILLAWLPYLLSYFPGTLTPDSFGELKIINNNFKSVNPNRPVDHHPILHMFFIKAPYSIGLKVFNNMVAAIACVTITQMLILAAIFASFITFLYKRKVNDIILLIITLFYALAPMHGFFSIVMWKDVIFGGLTLLLSMQLVKIIEKQALNKLKLKNLSSFIIISILCIFFRNNAIYMYFILAFVTLLLFRKYYKTFIIAFIIIFSFYFTIKGPVFKYFDIGKSKSSEYIGMPLQQIGRMAYKNVKFTNQEKKLIDKLIPVEIMAKTYNPRVSDGIKFNKNYNYKAFDKNKKEYLKLYLNLIRKHPLVTLEAYSISTLGYWYPGVEYWSVANNIWENDYGLKIYPKAPEFVRKNVARLEEKSLPIINIEWSIGLCFWIILIFLTMAIKKKKIIGIYPYIPIIGIWITMILASPVYGEFRYVYGAFTTLPLLMIYPYLNLKKDN